MKRLSILSVFLLVSSCAQPPKTETEMPSKPAKVSTASKRDTSNPLMIDEATRLALFDKFVSEMERLDGEGLLARKNRPEAWKKTVQRLKIELRNAMTEFEFGQVFKKLDATYPNIHAQVVLDPQFDMASDRLRPLIAARFAPEMINRGQTLYRYFISKVETDQVSALKELDRPGVGDEILEINGKAMRDWSKQNFIFCKFPLKEQCEANFFDHFRKELLGWDRTQPLVYKLRRNQREWTVTVPFRFSKGNASRVDSSEGCSDRQDRYPDFKIVFKGYNTCVYESEKYPNVAVLKISSFAYRGLSKSAPIPSLQAEVDQFNEKYWNAKSGALSKLIIDVIENGGGDDPIPWYQIFFKRPFQEQYVQFKKIIELENEGIRKNLFYEEPGREVWFESIKKSGIYGRTPMGGFLPQHPQFCAESPKNCADGLFQTKGNNFAGVVRIMTDEYCVSTCTGFVWEMKNRFLARAKVVGFPESGDSAYARLYVDILSKGGTYTVSSAARAGRTKQVLPEDTLLRQQVTVTRSTDASGAILSARPTMPDIWVPYRYVQPNESWDVQVFQAALKN